MSIDWRSAPDGATHYAPAFGAFKALWARKNSMMWEYHCGSSRGGWYEGVQPLDGEEFISRQDTANNSSPENS